MEWGYEEAAQESSHGSSRQTGRLSAQRGQTPCQPGKWSQGWLGQKPQEENCRPSQRGATAARPQEVIEIVIASICSRFGAGVIGLGDGGIRFAETSGAGVPDARTA